jgi:hypothetical protein
MRLSNDAGCNVLNAEDLPGDFFGEEDLSKKSVQGCDCGIGFESVVREVDIEVGFERMYSL